MQIKLSTACYCLQNAAQVKALNQTPLRTVVGGQWCHEAECSLWKHTLTNQAY